MPVGRGRDLFRAAVLVHERGAMDGDDSFHPVATVKGEEVSFARNVAVDRVFAAVRETDADGCALHGTLDVVTFFGEGEISVGVAKQETAKILALALVAAVEADDGVRAQLAVRTAVVASLERRLAAAERRAAELEAEAARRQQAQ